MTIAAKALLGVALFLAGALFGFQVENWRSSAAMTAHLEADRTAELAAIVKARKQELEMSIHANEVAESYEQGKKDAEAESQKTVADLLDGSLRLQNRWAGCEATRLSETATAASQLDAAKRDRAQSAGRIIAAAKSCDLQVRGLQAFVAAERKTQ